MSIHGSARSGFTIGAASYERGRPDYPEGAVAWMAGQLGLGPGRTVVDIGAGTGKLTRLLVPTGATVIAVEPVEAMSDVLHQLLPTVEIVQGTADRTGLARASADAVTAGQAFHWFASPAELAEIHRVLCPSGGLGLIWNQRRRNHPTWVAVDELIDELRRSEPDQSSQEWRQVLEASNLFSPLQGATFDQAQHLTPEELVDRVISISYVAILPQAQKAELAGRLRAVAQKAERSAQGRVTLPYRTAAFVCHAIP
jgi:ubiquinone/menaquinone biosynthesis C-methylase UbiE